MSRGSELRFSGQNRLLATALVALAASIHTLPGQEAWAQQSTTGRLQPGTYNIPSQPLSSAREAVMYLGLATVRALVLSIQVFSQFDQNLIRGFSIDALAQHCWVTGVMARRISELENAGPQVNDQCFLAGLLHDVGQLILASGLPEEYARVIAKANTEGISLWAAEQSCSR